MASVFKRGRWVDASGQKCPKDALGAKYVQSRLYTIQIVVDGRQKLFKGYTDRGASMQLAAKLERRKAQGEEGLIDPYEIHRKRPLAEHVADWIAELQQLGRSSIYVGLCGWRMARVIAEDAVAEHVEQHAFGAVGGEPIFFERGEGAYLFDIEHMNERQ